MRFRALIGCCAGALAAFALVGTAVANNGSGNGSPAGPSASASTTPSATGNAGGNGNGNGNQAGASAVPATASNAGGNGNGNGNGNQSSPSTSAAPATANGAGGNGTGSNHTAPGDSNHGDVWVDAAGAPPGPGHEMDPHLPCGTINLWGSFMADASGTFTVFAWPPTGSKAAVVTGSWAYAGPSHQTEKIGSFTILKSGHYYLTVSQDPVKHKTFWVKCPAQSPTPTPTPKQHQHHQHQKPTPTPKQKQAMKGGAGAAKAAATPGLPKTGVQQRLADSTTPVALIGLLLGLLVVGLVIALRRRDSRSGTIS